MQTPPAPETRREGKLRGVSSLNQVIANEGLKPEETNVLIDTFFERYQGAGVMAVASPALIARFWQPTRRAPSTQECTSSWRATSVGHCLQCDIAPRHAEAMTYDNDFAFGVK